MRCPVAPYSGPALPNLLRRSPNSDDDAGVLLSRGEVFQASFNLNAVMGNQRPSVGRGVRELLRIGPAGLARLRGCHDVESSGVEQVPNQNVYVFIQIELDEEAIHTPRTRGSINSSGMRLRSM